MEKVLGLIIAVLLAMILGHYTTSDVFRKKFDKKKYYEEEENDRRRKLRNSKFCIK